MKRTKTGYAFVRILEGIGRGIGRVFRILRKIAPPLKTAAIVITVGAVVYLAIAVFGFFNSDLFSKDAEIIIWNKAYLSAIDKKGVLDYNGAVEQFIISKNEMSESVGADSNEVAQVNLQLGALYIEMGKYREAEATLNDAYRVFEQNVKATDFKLVETKCQQARLKVYTGHFADGLNQAIDLYNSTKALAHKQYIKRYIADLYFFTGNYVKALDNYGEIEDYYYSLKDASDSAGASYFFIANVIGTVYYNGNEYAAAIEWGNIAVQTHKSYSDETDANLITAYINLARYYAISGQRDKSHEYIELAISGQTELTGKDSVDLAVIFRHIGQSYAMLHEYDKQLESLSTALEIVRSLYGEDHTLAASLYSYIASHYSAIEDYPKAIEYSQKALALYRRLFGDANENAARELGNLASCFYANGEFEKAIEASQAALDIWIEIFGGDNIRTAEGYIDLAWINVKCGNTAEALALAQHGFDLSNVSGEITNELLLDSCQVLGYAEMKNGMLEDALNHLLLARQGYISLKGNKQFDIAKTETYLGDLYRQLNRPEDSVSTLMSAMWVYRTLYPLGIPQEYEEQVKNLLRPHYESEDTELSLDEWISEKVDAAIRKAQTEQSDENTTAKEAG